MALNTSLLSSWGVSSATISLFEGFINPSNEVRPKIRWWWVHGEVDVDEVRDEVDQIYAAGFGGVELQDVHHSISSSDPVDPEGHGWGTQPWIDGVVAAMDQEAKHGMTHDMAMGPAWDLGIPSITPDDDAAAKEICLGYAYVASGTTYDDSIPGPYKSPASAVKNQTLYILQAWRVNSASDRDADPVLLDYGSGIDLTDNVTSSNTIIWTPPDNATWILYSAWVRGSAQMPEDYPHTDPLSYVVDHFSELGVQAVADYWESNLLLGDFKALLAEVGNAFMEDSLEMVTTSYWTPKYPEEFKSRTGYDINSILPAVLQQDSENIFHFADSNLSRGARNDYWNVISDLYVEKHVKPMKAWCHQVGMQYRAQPYGIPFMDGMRASTILDITEGENLGFLTIDQYRSLAGANTMTGKKIVSNEACAFSKNAYQTTWNQVLNALAPDWAAGVTQNILHGFSYIYAPNFTWPGFAAFTPYKGIGYSESWGPRIPEWHHVTDITGYLARMQYVLREGVPSHDVAFVKQNGDLKLPWVRLYFTTTGASIGWSSNNLDPALLNLPSAYVEDNHFAPTAANYQMIAFEGDLNSDLQPVLTLETAEKFLGYAKEGLPILAIGNWSNPQAYGLSERQSTPRITALIDELFNLPNARNALTVDDIPAVMESLGVQPRVRYDSSSLIHMHRIIDDLDTFVFVANSTDSPVNQTVSIPRSSPNAVPVMLDAWTGDFSMLPVYSEVSTDRLEIPVALSPGQTTLIILLPVSGAVKSRLNHVISTTASSIVWDSTGSHLYARSTSKGTFYTQLNNGTTVESTIVGVAGPIPLNNWKLDVASYEPAHGNGTGSTQEEVTETKYVSHNLTLSSLRAWTDIDELEDVSGVGIYSAHVTLTSDHIPASDQEDKGVYLNLSPFHGSFRIWLNGNRMPPLDQLATQFDITTYLRIGSNSIQIEVTTSLLNRMRVVQPDIYESQPRQSFGLLGVTLQPFKQVRVL